MRHEHWPSLLAAFLADEKPFEWGVRDCSLFAADAVLCMTGVDLAAKYRGKYKTAKGAAKYLKNGLVALVDKTGLEPIPPLMAQRGDVVLIETDGRDALAIIDLSGRVAGQGAEGIEIHPLASAKAAWRVA